MRWLLGNKRETLRAPSRSRDVAMSQRSGEWSGAEVVDEYVYYDEQGEPFLRVERTTDKKFLQAHWDKKKRGWAYGKPNGTVLPYFLQDLIKAAAGEQIFVCEGEKDTESVIDLGLVATCASGSRWTADLDKWFTGRKIAYILQDNDKAGRHYAKNVARHLCKIVEDVRIVALPGLADKGDVTDWIAAGGAKGAACA